MFTKQDIGIMKTLIEAADSIVPIQAGIWKSGPAALTNAPEGSYELQLELNGHTVCIISVQESDNTFSARLTAWLMPGACKAMFAPQELDAALELVRATLWDAARNIVEGLSMVMAHDEGIVVADA